MVVLNYIIKTSKLIKGDIVPMSRIEKIFIDNYKIKYGRSPNIKEVRIFLATNGWITNIDIYTDIVFGMCNDLLNAFDVYYTHDDTDITSASKLDEYRYNIEKRHVLDCIKRKGFNI